MLIEFHFGVKSLVAKRIADDAMIFCDSKIGTFKSHISLWAHKAEFHGFF
jgi:hypothetical protein